MLYLALEDDYARLQRRLSGMFGNHEFDNPLTVLRQQEKWAKFPLLSANIYQKSTGERLFKPWALFNRQDLKIAVIGLTTDDTAKIGNPEYFTDIEFRKPADEAKLVIQELQQTEKPDIIIAATHMGHYDNGEHGSNAPGDVEMARARFSRLPRSLSSSGSPESAGS